MNCQHIYKVTVDVASFKKTVLEAHSYEKNWIYISYYLKEELKPWLENDWMRLCDFSNILIYIYKGLRDLLFGESACEAISSYWQAEKFLLGLA